MHRDISVLWLLQPMINKAWLSANAVVVPDEAVIFVRHPRHFLIKIDQLSWVRYNPEDASDVYEAKTGLEARSILRSAKADPNRLVEVATSADKLIVDLKNQDLVIKFERDFGVEDCQFMQIIRETFPEAKQVLLKLAGGNSWFIWGLKEGVL